MLQMMGTLGREGRGKQDHLPNLARDCVCKLADEASHEANLYMPAPSTSDWE